MPAALGGAAPFADGLKLLWKRKTSSRRRPKWPAVSPLGPSWCLIPGSSPGLVTLRQNMLISDVGIAACSLDRPQQHPADRPADSGYAAITSIRFLWAAGGGPVRSAPRFPLPWAVPGGVMNEQSPQHHRHRQPAEHGGSSAGTSGRQPWAFLDLLDLRPWPNCGAPFRLPRQKRSWWADTRRKYSGMKFAFSNLGSYIIWCSRPVVAVLYLGGWGFPIRWSG